MAFFQRVFLETLVLRRPLDKEKSCQISQQGSRSFLVYLLEIHTAH